LALTVVLAAFRFIDYRIGNGKRAIIAECPHKVEALAETMHNMETHLSRIVDDVSLTKAGTVTLVRQHAPTDGREQWKMSPRLEAVMERVDANNERMTTLQQQTINGNEKIVTLLSEIKGVLQNA